MSRSFARKNETIHANGKVESVHWDDEYFHTVHKLLLPRSRHPSAQLRVWMATSAALQTAVMKVVYSGVRGDQESATLHSSYRFGLDRQARRHVRVPLLRTGSIIPETAAQRGNQMRGQRRLRCLRISSTSHHRTSGNKTEMCGMLKLR